MQLIGLLIAGGAFVGIGIFLQRRSRKLLSTSTFESNKYALVGLGLTIVGITILMPLWLPEIIRWFR